MGRDVENIWIPECLVSELGAGYPGVFIKLYTYGSGTYDFLYVL